jgi:hypothetical protein
MSSTASRLLLTPLADANHKCHKSKEEEIPPLLLSNKVLSDTEKGRNCIAAQVSLA